MPNLPPLPLIDNHLFIDNSGWMEGMSTCQRALQYRQLHARVSAGESAALNFGSAIHLALEYRYKQFRTNPLPDTYYDVIAGELAYFFTDHPVPEDDFRNINWALEIARRYNDITAVEPFSLMEYKQPQTCSTCNGKGRIDYVELDTPLDRSCIFCNGTGQNSTMVELPFAIPLFVYLPKAGPYVDQPINIMYTGRIDLPVLWENQLFILDHKTTSILGPTFFDKMKMSAQAKGYAWAFERLTGTKVAGYCINAIRSKEPPLYVTDKTKKSSTTPAQWWRESFQRERFFINPGELQEWETNAIALVEEMMFNYERDYMPMKTTWCTSYGRCPYFDVCSTISADREVMLGSGLYKDNTWSPLKQVEKKV